MIPQNYIVHLPPANLELLKLLCEEWGVNPEKAIRVAIAVAASAVAQSRMESQ